MRDTYWVSKHLFQYRRAVVMDRHQVVYTRRLWIWPWIPGSSAGAEARNDRKNPGQIFGNRCARL